ncbi:MAG TPA: neutral zinc metallopeptidase [Jatrophihabitantaceae bacterium]
MSFNPNAKLDPSQVEDAGRGSSLGGRGIAVGGGGLGIVGIIVYLALTALTGGSVAGGLGDLSGQAVGQGGSAATLSECKTGADANRLEACRAVGYVNSVQAWWKTEFAAGGKSYTPATTVFFEDSTNTGCGPATTDVGPFYCPADKHVYIDLGFFQELHDKFGATAGSFAQGYVLAHEYGHHVQDLLGIESQVRTRQGPTSDSVRLELQADCFAGVWAKHATEPGADGSPALISEITTDDFDRALDAASRIGDDWIQKNLGGGTVQQDKFTHGSSAQRKKWLTTGYQTGDPNSCDTFSASNLG